MITWNEEGNLERALDTVSWADEIVVVDSGSSDRTEAIARSFQVRFFDETWKGFAAQKNSAIDKCVCDWILTLDDNEALSDVLAMEIRGLLESSAEFDGYAIPRRTLLLGRWLRRGGFYPDPKLRLFRRGSAEYELRPIQKKLHFVGKRGRLTGDLVHSVDPTLGAYVEHMDRYSTSGAARAASFSGRDTNIFAFVLNIFVNPFAIFLANYLLRLGFLDGREGLLAHMYRSVHASAKYARAWELSRAE
jgi:glycosyltransferase involved in cell wall biosynthesis